MYSAQFIGSACGKHSSYTFYKAFKYRKKEKYKILTLGQFFFIQISESSPICVAELQLLWEDNQSKEKLSSTKLYFLPESTPEGRLDIHGEDELLAVSGKLVLKLDDLVSWIRCDVSWHKGISLTPSNDISYFENPADRLLRTFAANNRTFHVEDVKKEKQLIGESDDDCPSVTILSFPRYCRYRASLKRLEGQEGCNWAKNSLVQALGGFTAQKGKEMYVMFCRDVFEYPELFENEKCCHHLAPSLKGRPRKRRRKLKRSVSPSSESNDSVESKASVNSRVRRCEVNGFKRKKLDLESKSQHEQEFYEKLFKFMEERNSPIDRIPNLGFKQIDLFFFYCHAKKMGGYDKICERRLWKHMYDELGGCQGSTSAATCTRRHYERLLLPFERAMKKEVNKKAKESKSKEQKVEKSEKKPIKSPQEATLESDKPEKVEETNHEVAKCTEKFEKAATPSPIVEIKQEQPLDAVTQLSQVDEKKRKNVTPISSPILTKKPKEEDIVQKEKKWEEIRKKNALARAKNFTEGMWPTRVHKKVHVSCPMQQPKMELPASFNETVGVDNQKVPASTNGPSVISPVAVTYSARPSVIKHTPSSGEFTYKNFTHNAISSTANKSNTMKNLKNSVLSPWKSLSVCQLPPPTSVIHPSSSLPQNHSVPVSTVSSKAAVKPTETNSFNIAQLIAPHSASNLSHSASILSHSASILSHSASNLSHSASNLSHSASNLSHSASNLSRSATSLPRVAIKSESIGSGLIPHRSDIRKPRTIDSCGAFDLSVKNEPKTKVEEPICIDLSVSTDSNDKEIDLSFRRRKVDLSPVKDGKIGFSPLMSLSTMSAKLMEKNRLNSSTKSEPVRTVKVPPMVNTNCSPKFANSDRQKLSDKSKPVMGVSPRTAQVLDGAKHTRTSDAHSSARNHLAMSLSSGANMNHESSPLLASSIPGHFGYPHFSTYPYMFPSNPILGSSKPQFLQNHSFPSGQYPTTASYFPPPSVFGMPPISTEQAGLSQEHFQANLASYKDLMQRGNFPVYPGYSALDSAQLFAASHLRPDHLPTSAMHKP